MEEITLVLLLIVIDCFHVNATDTGCTEKNFICLKIVAGESNKVYVFGGLWNKKSAADLQN